MARREEFKMDGKDLVAKIKQLLAEGNVRRIIIKNKGDKTLIEVPLTVGVAGVVLAPTLAAIGALAALLTECTLVIEREAE